MTSRPEPILPRVAAGDPEAFQECVDRYKSLVWWLARKWVGLEADDAVQEIFLNIWRNADKYDESKAAESTFISVIARRRLIDLSRRSGRRPTHEPLDEDFNLVGQMPETVEAGAEMALAGQVIANQLNENERTVLKLSIHEGLSHSEIAHLLGIPLGTVKTYLRRSLQRIRTQLNGPSPASSANPEEVAS